MHYLGIVSIVFSLLHTFSFTTFITLNKVIERWNVYVESYVNNESEFGQHMNESVGAAVVTNIVVTQINTV